MEDVGKIHGCEMLGMPESTRELLWEILAQNRMIVSANCEAMRLIGSPMIIVNRNDA